MISKDRIFAMIGVALAVIIGAALSTAFFPGATAAPPPGGGSITGNYELRDKSGFYNFEEFMKPGISGTTNTSIYERTWSGTGADAGATTAPLKPNSMGVAAMTTGTTTTGYAYMRTNNILFFGGGDRWEAEIGIDSILRFANATDAYSLRVGFHDALGADNVTDGVFFLYDSIGVSTGSAASGKWQCVTANNSARTFFTTTTAVKQTPTKLRILIMPRVSTSGDSAVFIIDDVVVRSETSNIPADRTRACGFGIHMRNTAGTIAGRTIWYDYAMIRCDYRERK